MCQFPLITIISWGLPKFMSEVILCCLEAQIGLSKKLCDNTWELIFKNETSIHLIPGFAISELGDFGQVI